MYDNLSPVVLEQQLHSAQNGIFHPNIRSSSFGESEGVFLSLIM